MPTLEEARSSRAPWAFPDALVDRWLADRADRRRERFRRVPPPTVPVYGWCATAGRVAVIENRIDWAAWQ